MEGSGGHPYFEVRETAIHFHDSLLDRDNRRRLMVYNNGKAEAVAEAECSSGLVHVDPEGSFFVPPQSQREVILIYHPTSLEPLEATLRLSAPDSDEDEYGFLCSRRALFSCLLGFIFGLVWFLFCFISLCFVCVCVYSLS